MAKPIENKFEHSILLDDITTEDIDTGTNSNFKNAANKSERSIKASVSFGFDTPLIQINEYVFSGQGDISSFEIDSTGFLPKCTASFIIVENSFISKSIPKDGDLMSVFLTSKYDEFNPIRNDYLITDVSTNETKDTEANVVKMIITGELWIPKLDKEICKSFNGSSHKVLGDIAKDLNLGYSTNVNNTSDSQKWIATYDTYRDHISYITDHSWNNSNSFYISFIDVFYTLNFIEVNEQLKPHLDFIPAVATINGPDNNYKGPEFDDTAQLIFTNYKDQSNTNFYIESYKLINNAGRINRNNGYIKDIKIYDFNNTSDETFTIESMISDGSEKNKIIFKGRVGEDYYKDQKKTKFIGILMNGDEYQMHKNYHYAVVHNMMNNDELGKLNLQINTKHMNFNVHRYQNIECAFIIQYNRSKANELSAKDELGNQEPVLDNFYTGSYLVKGLKIRYGIRTGFRSEFVLARREWPSPDDPKAHT